MSGNEAGNGFIGGQPMYYEREGDRMDIFPGGLPRGHHSQMPHDHLVVNGDGGVEYMRVNGMVVNDYLG